MHALNGNGSIIQHEQIALLRDFQDSILYIMESLKDAPQITIDSFFEVQENCFLIWIFSKSLLRKYGLTPPESKETILLMPFMGTTISLPLEDKLKNNKKQSLLIPACQNLPKSLSPLLT
ncbi:hypothetical protein AMATHDRAFT_10626 [Amanita thiersii Skay4041]|uniref:Uncharacterized protein n=1 Tax=Amanita thiersii Skay4041 TaxID=703135 RepID=A0A2A9NB57_9AGAR|nr:hypothetical protein AMATHDRAFT_10626 [Amanita thiersii Skay4041]